MACEICEHCSAPLRTERYTIRDGYSYHEECHKCYVCSETNLQNAEVFKGVIFCSSCSQRIFQGCSTVRQQKNTKTHRRRNSRLRDDRTPKERVLELTTLQGSTGSDSRTRSDEVASSKTSGGFAVVDIKAPTKNDTTILTKVSQEIGIITDVTKAQLDQVNDVNHVKSDKETVPVKPRQKRNGRRRYRPKSKPECSDLRIAELGKSTEIANMALRNKKEVPVIIQSDTNMKKMNWDTSSAEKKETDDSGNVDGSWLDSDLSTIDECKGIGQPICKMIKEPLKLFKRKIIDRSSLVDAIILKKYKKKSLKKLHKVHQEYTQHQRRGIRRLYSTIKRNKSPYKLGWVTLVSKSNCCIRSGDCEVHPARCKHMNSHNYRCMRNQAMKLAGPTKSQLAIFRARVRDALLPNMLLDLLNLSWNEHAMLMSAACGNSKPPSII